jgi:glycosyltransferase involved in cell wall biosynthesis
VSNELVSVIVPAYCHEAFVRDCLQSIHTQTHQRMELIVIDDCSPDRTFETVKDLLQSSFAYRFERVVFRRKLRSRGAYDSLNIGLGLAKGEYIAVVNSDDLIAPLRLERLLLAMARSDSELAFSLIDVLDDRTPEERELGVPTELLLLQLRQHLALARDPSVAFALLRWNVAASSGNVMFTSGLAKRLGRFAPLAYSYGWDFILQATVHTEPVAITEPLYAYRLRGRNATRKDEQIARSEAAMVYRRFFRSVLKGRPPNANCPGPQGWPGYFETVIQSLGLWPVWAKEAGERLPTWRTYERRYWAAERAPGEVRSVEQAVRFLSEHSKVGM